MLRVRLGPCRPSMKGDAVQKCHLTFFGMSLKFSLPLPRPVGRLRFRRPILSWGMVVRADPSCLPLGRPAVRTSQKRLPEMPEIPETPPGVHPLGETVKLRTGWSSARGLQARHGLGGGDAPFPAESAKE